MRRPHLSEVDIDVVFHLPEAPPVGEDYVPDAQDEIIGDAISYGGHVFAAEVQGEAIAAAFASSGWDGQGDEPPEHYSAWLATAWQLVDQRRAEIADGMIRPDLPEA